MKNLNLTQNRPLSFSEMERQCEELFLSRGPFYHLCTPGEATLTLFETDDDYRFAMNLVALVTHLVPDVNVITFEVMGSHLHLIGEGQIPAARDWFRLFRKRLYRFYQSTGRVRNLDAFQANIIPVDSLGFLRNSIAYVNRNGYLVHPEHTPFSYPWGANRFYFNPDARLRREGCYGDLVYDEKRHLFRSNTIGYPASHAMVDGYISPASFCDLDLGEGFFRDARHYFSLVSRSVEGYQDIAKLLGDSFFCTDDELFLIVRQIARDKYGNSRPETLPPEHKRELAKTLHFDYKASDQQIRRMLRVEDGAIRALFGR